MITPLLFIYLLSLLNRAVCLCR